MEKEKQNFLVKKHVNPCVTDTIILSFKDDEEFTNYCLKPDPIIRTNDVCTYYDYEYSDNYLNDVENGVLFKIEDSNSKVKKRGVVCRKLITKPVQNLC